MHGHARAQKVFYYLLFLFFNNTRFSQHPQLHFHRIMDFEHWLCGTLERIVQNIFEINEVALPKHCLQRYEGRRLARQSLHLKEFIFFGLLDCEAGGKTQNDGRWDGMWIWLHQSLDACLPPRPPCHRPHGYATHKPAQRPSAQILIAWPPRSRMFVEHDRASW